MIIYVVVDLCDLSHIQLSSKKIQFFWAAKQQRTVVRRMHYQPM